MRRILNGSVMWWVIAVCMVTFTMARAQYTPNGNSHYSEQLARQPVGKTSAIAATTTSAAIALSTTANQVQIVNASTGLAFVIFCPAVAGCTASVGATGGATSDFPVLAGQAVVVTVPIGSKAAAVVVAVAGTVYLTPVAGV